MVNILKGGLGWWNMLQVGGTSRSSVHTNRALRWLQSRKSHLLLPRPPHAGVSPPLVKQIVPLFEQLTPIYLDVANGAQEFNPPPEETRGIIRSGEARWLVGGVGGRGRAASSAAARAAC